VSATISTIEREPTLVATFDDPNRVAEPAARITAAIVMHALWTGACSPDDYTAPMGALDRFDAIPKVELHCHVEGTVRPKTVLELARKHGRELPTDDPTELYRFHSLDSFLAVFWLVQELIGDRDDWARVAYESLVDAVPHGLRYREMFFTPARHLAAGQSLAEIVAGLIEGIEAAEQETDVRCSLICDIDRAYGGAAAAELATALRELRRSGAAERVIGIGMDSTERGVDPRDFAPAYTIAREAGLRATGHAGEDTGPENIAAAIDALALERIDHGIAVVEDAELMARLSAARVPFDVCPTSNVVIANRFERLAEHPFRLMREAGLLVTINTDDPAMTDLDLGTEYRNVAAALGYGFDEMCAIAMEGVEATWLDESARRALRTSFEREIAAIPTA
jgi:adenosine deaminase